VVPAYAHITNFTQRPFDDTESAKKGPPQRVFMAPRQRPRQATAFAASAYSEYAEVIEIDLAEIKEPNPVLPE